MANYKGDTYIARQNRDAVTLAEQVKGLQQWFGQPNRDVQIGAYDKLAVTSHTLPDAFRGRSLFLRDTIDGFIFEQNEWPTTLALPWAFSDEIHFTFNEWKFNTTLAGAVPHEGISRMITSSSKTSQAHSVRRGLSFMLEHGFWRTAAGQEQYRRNTIGIKQCVQETQNYDVEYSLRYCKNYEREWQKQRGMLEQKVSKLMENEITYFVVCQKGIKGFDFMLANLTKRLGQYKVKPDLLIVPPDFRLYYSQTDPQKTQYWQFGPDGVLALKEGPMAAARIADMNVIETRHLEISETDPPVNPFENEVAHGEHYFGWNVYVGMAIPDFKSHWLDTYIYKERDQDDFVKIPWREAFLYCQRFQEGNGTLRPEHRKIAELAHMPGPDQMPALKQGVGAYAKALAQAPGTLGAAKALAPPQNSLRDPFLFLDALGHYHEVHFMGQMELDYFRNDDVRYLAEGAVHKVFEDPGEREAAINALQALVRLVDQSERVRPTREFLIDMISINLPYSSNAEGRFVGEETPQELVRRFNVPPIREASGNQFGGWDYPKQTANPAYRQWPVPPFLGSEPQLRTLAALAGSGDATVGWQDAAAIARRGIEVVDRLDAFAAEAFGSSIFFTASNRFPWFHSARNTTNWVQSLLLVPRDPVFIALPNAGGTPDRSKRARGAADAQAADAVLQQRRAAAQQQQQLPAFLVQFFAEDARALADARELVIQKTAEQAGVLERIVLAVFENARSDAGFTLESFRSSLVRVARLLRHLNALADEARTNAITALAAVSSERLGGAKVPARQVQAALRELKTITDEPAAATTDALYPQRNYQIKAELKIPDTIAFPGAATSDQNAEIQAAAAARSAAGGVAPQPAPLQSGMSFRWQGQGDAAWSNATATWVRVPLSSNTAFVETMLELGDAAVAAPGNPFMRHLAPLALATITEGDYNLVVRQRPHYTATLESSNTIHRDLNDVSAITIYERWSTASGSEALRGKNVLASEARAAAGLSSAAMPSQQQQQQQRSASRAVVSMLLGPQPPPERAPLGAYSPEVQSQVDQSLSKKRAYDEWNRIHEEQLGAGSAPARVLTDRDIQELVRSGYVKSYAEQHRALTEGNMAHRWNHAKQIANPLMRVFAIMFLGAANIQQQWLALIDNDVLPPASLVYWRLFITRRLHTVVMMKGGYETGATFYGHSDVILGDDVISKIHYANYTFYSKAVVIQPKNIMLGEYVMASELVSGMGTKFFTHVSEFGWQTGRHGADILVTLIPYRERDFPNPMDFTGQHQIPDANPALEDHAGPHYVSAPYYRLIWPMMDKILAATANSKANYGSTNRVQTTSFWGTQFFYNRATHLFENVHENTGHTGRNGAGRGAAAVLSGKAAQLPEQKWSEYRLP